MPSRLGEVARLFLKLGLTAFGGPAAAVAMLRNEVVARRKWLTDQEFLDLLGATNLIPGPNSTEMAIHLGYVRAGWPGLIVGGACFILPAMAMVMLLAWVYVRFGSLPEVGWLLYGILPVIIAIIAQALWGLGRAALKDPLTGLVGLAVLGLSFFGVNELALLFAGGLLVMLVRNFTRLRARPPAALLLPLAGLGAAGAAAVPFSLPLLFLTFLKIGAVLYGSGYVLLAFLRADFVQRLGWLTDRQLLDAIVVGQITPGPLFTSATFVGFLLGGVSGALWATLGIFLPAFIFVAVTNPYIPRLRASPWFAGLLDGVNAASLGLMAAVTWHLGRSALVDLPSLLIGAVTLFLLLRFRLNASWLVLGGGLIGVLKALIH
jgi:chromate transporter